MAFMKKINLVIMKRNIAPWPLAVKQNLSYCLQISTAWDIAPAPNQFTDVQPECQANQYPNKYS
jgi:hypothetical protein